MHRYRPVFDTEAPNGILLVTSAAPTECAKRRAVFDRCRQTDARSGETVETSGHRMRSLASEEEEDTANRCDSKPLWDLS